MPRRYADVEYFRMLFRDAELIDGIWYFDDGLGNFNPFVFQEQVKPLHEPQLTRGSAAAHTAVRQAC